MAAPNAIFVTRCTLRDAQFGEIDDFTTFSEKARVMRKQIHLMNKTGHAPITQRFQFECDYAVPADGPSIHWEEVGLDEADIFTVTYDGGQTVTFSGVHVLDVGDSTVEGENTLVRKILFGATARKEGDYPQSTGNVVKAA
jgi:hypothetical protein